MIFFTLFGVLFTLNNSVRSSYLNLTATVQTTFIFLHDNININDINKVRIIVIMMIIKFMSFFFNDNFQVVFILYLLFFCK